jgi:hypothetical protein
VRERGERERSERGGTRGRDGGRAGERAREKLELMGDEKR